MTKSRLRVNGEVYPTNATPVQSGPGESRLGHQFSCCAAKPEQAPSSGTIRERLFSCGAWIVIGKARNATTHKARKRRSRRSRPPFQQLRSSGLKPQNAGKPCQNDNPRHNCQFDSLGGGGNGPSRAEGNQNKIHNQLKNNDLRAPPRVSHRELARKLLTPSPASRAAWWPGLRQEAEAQRSSGSARPVSLITRRN